MQHPISFVMGRLVLEMSSAVIAITAATIGKREIRPGGDKTISPETTSADRTSWVEFLAVMQDNVSTIFTASLHRMTLLSSHLYFDRLLRGLEFPMAMASQVATHEGGYKLLLAGKPQLMRLAGKTTLYAKPLIASDILRVHLEKKLLKEKLTVVVGIAVALFDKQVLTHYTPPCSHLRQLTKLIFCS